MLQKRYRLGIRTDDNGIWTPQREKVDGSSASGGGGNVDGGREGMVTGRRNDV